MKIINVKFNFDKIKNKDKLFAKNPNETLTFEKTDFLTLFNALYLMLNYDISRRKSNVMYLESEMKISPLNFFNYTEKIDITVNFVSNYMTIGEHILYTKKIKDLKSRYK